MERRVTVELERRPGQSVGELVGQLTAAGAAPVPGFDPVPMKGSPPSVCITIVVGPEAEERIRALPQLRQIWSDPEVEPMDATPAGGERR